MIAPAPLARPVHAPDRALRFAGYAALFDIADAGHDTIRRGAFSRTLAEREDPLPLLWQHRPDVRIGWVEAISEDARGLRVIAAIDNPRGLAGLALQRGQVSGLSFGYRARISRRSPAGRELLGLDLFEVSLVTTPMQHGARVHLVS
ncbi:HK97 family phage prohead protease [Novosphingobium sp. 1949]|uniref:HK97 family phage prohead protease n=1 Tax=Novosphingobium organovorum TaxID=2930092 RepID=A0ABT0BGR9_9SPHN|nr:HK97 family phage prohead protease [Novosphingobium organovorum]MCJ2184224.1 HK97 family phage prohead protease [Novosphingobium organovorum]